MSDTLSNMCSHAADVTSMVTPDLTEQDDTWLHETGCPGLHIFDELEMNLNFITQISGLMIR